MATIRQIRRRIRSVTSTAKITKAMELVAASKMRRVQMRALAARPYAEKLREMLADLAESLEGLRAEACTPCCSGARCGRPPSSSSHRIEACAVGSMPT